MKKKISIVKIIGFGLGALYLISLATYSQFFNVATFHINIIFFVIIFCLLVISSIGVVTLREWGRQLMVISNVAMFVILLMHMVNKIGVVHFSYIFMTVIVFLYFNQSKIKLQFYRKNIGGWKSILVIDDEEGILKMIRPMLMSYGYAVLTAKTGEMGIEIAKQQKPELIILDVILPGMKGREVCKVLKNNEVTKNIPVVFLTSKASADDIQAEMALGASAHLSKPLDSKVLISTIRSALEMKRQ